MCREPTGSQSALPQEVSTERALDWLVDVSVTWWMWPLSNGPRAGQRRSATSRGFSRLCCSSVWCHMNALDKTPAWFKTNTLQGRRTFKFLIASQIVFRVHFSVEWVYFKWSVSCWSQGVHTLFQGTWNSWIKNAVNEHFCFSATLKISLTVWIYISLQSSKQMCAFDGFYVKCNVTETSGTKTVFWSTRLLGNLRSCDDSKEVT